MAASLEEAIQVAQIYTQVLDLAFAKAAAPILKAYRYLKPPLGGAPLYTFIVRLAQVMAL